MRTITTLYLGSTHTAYVIDAPDASQEHITNLGAGACLVDALRDWARCNSSARVAATAGRLGDTS
jgi:hypothetical protein